MATCSRGKVWEKGRQLEEVPEVIAMDILAELTFKYSQLCSQTRQLFFWLQPVGSEVNISSSYNHPAYIDLPQNELKVLNILCSSDQFCFYPLAFILLAFCTASPPRCFFLSSLPISQRLPDSTGISH